MRAVNSCFCFCPEGHSLPPASFNLDGSKDTIWPRLHSCFTSSLSLLGAPHRHRLPGRRAALNEINTTWLREPVISDLSNNQEDGGVSDLCHVSVNSPCTHFPHNKQPQLHILAQLIGSLGFYVSGICLCSPWCWHMQEITETESVFTICRLWCAQIIQISLLVRSHLWNHRLLSTWQRKHL